MNKNIFQKLKLLSTIWILISRQQLGLNMILRKFKNCYLGS